MLRWMAPFLSFTAEEAWKRVVGKIPKSIFLETFAAAARRRRAAGQVGRIREMRDMVNKDIEALRAAGQVGSSLQARWRSGCRADRPGAAGGASLGDDLKFVFITSAALSQPT
jgi:isoleucyl-tRNA synthetase